MSRYVVILTVPLVVGSLIPLQFSSSMGCANGASKKTWSCVKQDVLL